jgi:hypothetical protein
MTLMTCQFLLDDYYLIFIFSSDDILDCSFDSLIVKSFISYLTEAISDSSSLYWGDCLFAFISSRV